MTPEEQTTLPSSLQSDSQRKELYRVVELFRARDLWEALDRVLRSEQLWHLREAALSSGEHPISPDYHRSVANWLESVLNGALKNYAEQAAEELKSDDEKAKTLTDLAGETRLQEADSGDDYLYK